MKDQDQVEAAERAPAYPVDAGSAAESTSDAIAALLADPRGFREAAARLTARLLRRVGADQLDRVEDAVQEAFVAAARSWPVAGTPADPMAWLSQVARRRYLDLARAARRLVDDADALDAAAGDDLGPDDANAVAAEIAPLADDQVRLLFMCCHPALTAESRVALTLKCVGQLSVEEIARLLRADASAVAQRLVRAKRTLREHRATFEVPPPSELPARLRDVLAVCYALFTEGHLATEGDALIRPELCGEALRAVTQLTRWPDTALPEVFALQALLCFHAARLPARAAGGVAVPLAEQDRTQWHRALIARGVQAFARAAEGERLTRYHLEAQIALLHTTAADYAGTDWDAIVLAYDQLLVVAPSPLARLARVVALAEGARDTGALAEALAAAQALERELGAWPEVHAVVATLCTRVGDVAGARAAYDRALALPLAAPVRAHLTTARDAVRG
ncbi:MAG: sigma-70 family RNA polymerase sigma factor [Gemmatimonadetes bacterium]|nr:sigma-70 family RNA polymerase sigma factor [Gemmatimonadota bacterium]